jgi:hypothetical protein
LADRLADMLETIAVVVDDLADLKAAIRSFLARSGR